jgi:predicted acyl esterase
MSTSSGQAVRASRLDGIDLSHVLRRLRRMRRLAARVVPAGEGLRVDRDVAVPMRDGVVLRANVFRPVGDDPVPVLVCAHPYGKDAVPADARRTRDGGYRLPFQMRMLPQTESYEFSQWTSWEAPDPAAWVAAGYAVVNADLRGWGTSEGVGELLSAQEGRDGHDLVEWVAEQPWCDGHVGMLGVSYLALSQWAVAAERPPHLEAICPWEGFTDAYADFVRPGGVLERGFLRVWVAGLRAQRRSPVTMGREARRRPLVDEWWLARDRDIEHIDVPMLVCGSFSDHNLHSVGSFEGFRRAGSDRKWLFTHRGGKWATFYSPEAHAAQLRFFDHVLKGEDNGMAEQPAVRLEVRSDASTVTSVRDVESWPPPGTTWRPLYLDAGGWLSEHTGAPGSVEFDHRRERAAFTWTFDRDTEVVGPMWASLRVEVIGADDVSLFVGVRKVRSGRVVGFEGSYGFDRALVTHGMRKASQRHCEGPVDDAPWRRGHTDDRRAPLAAGEVVTVEVELASSATHFAAGDQLRLEVQGRWFFAMNPFVGQFPARYEPSRKGRTRVHLGGATPSALFVPVQGSAEA